MALTALATYDTTVVIKNINQAGALGASYNFVTPTGSASGVCRSTWNFIITAFDASGAAVNQFGSLTTSYQFFMQTTTSATANSGNIAAWPGNGTGDPLIDLSPNRAPRSGFANLGTVVRVVTPVITATDYSIAGTDTFNAKYSDQFTVDFTHLERKTGASNRNNLVCVPITDGWANNSTLLNLNAQITVIQYTTP